MTTIERYLDTIAIVHTLVNIHGYPSGELNFSALHRSTIFYCLNRSMVPGYCCRVVLVSEWQLAHIWSSITLHVCTCYTLTSIWSSWPPGGKIDEIAYLVWSYDMTHIIPMVDVFLKESNTMSYHKTSLVKYSCTCLSYHVEIPLLSFIRDPTSVTKCCCYWLVLVLWGYDNIFYPGSSLLSNF